MGKFGEGYCIVVIYVIREAKAPVLEGSGSRRLYRRKGTSVNRVYVVFGARVYLGFFTIRQKRIRGGSTYAACNSGY